MHPLVLLLLPVWEISYFVRCDTLVLWYYVQPAHMDVVDSLSTASGADTVPSLDFDLITTVESENLWCEQCKVFKKNYEKLQEEHALSYNTLKKKIISTDLLIKKYKSKCEDHDQQTRKLEDSVKKQEQLQREAETLQSQLSAALCQIEPLKQEKLVHEQEKKRQLQEIQTLRDQIVAGESFKTQYEQLNRSLLEGKEKHDQEIKDANKRIRELEQSQQKLEIQLTKVKASEVSQQLYGQHGFDEEMINIITSIIIILTGYPPVNAEHVYNLLQHIYTFPHPYPILRGNTGGTLPIPQSVAASLPGWEDIAPQQMHFIHAVFNHILEQDQKLVRDIFYIQLGRAPTVQEFAQFLLNFQGNELVESPRKTLGQTFIENHELRVTLERLRRDMGWLTEIHSSLANIAQLLGESSTRNMRRLYDLETRQRDFQNVLDEVQQQNVRLQLDHNSIQRELTECHMELEDERKDKQMYQLRWEELKTVEEQIQAEKQQLLTDNQQLLTDNQQLLTDNHQLPTDNHQLLSDKQQLLTYKQALKTTYILLLLLLLLLPVFLFMFLF